jgi:hypothetical protein
MNQDKKGGDKLMKRIIILVRTGFASCDWES